jgi:hypothetical protein
MIYGKGMKRQYEQVKSELSVEDQKDLESIAEIPAITAMVAEVEDIAFNFGKGVGDLDRMVKVKRSILDILVSSHLLHKATEEALKVALDQCKASDRVVRSAKNLVAEELTSKVINKYNERNQTKNRILYESDFFPYE